MSKRPAVLLVAIVMLIAGANATAAQAEPKIQADSYPATVTGVAAKASIFIFGNSPSYRWECAAVPIQGSLAGESNEFTFSPAYEGCRWNYPVFEPPIWSSNTVKMNGCTYKLHGLKKATGKYTALADLLCPVGKQVEVELHTGMTTDCKLTLGAQSNKSEVRLVDESGKEPPSSNQVQAEIDIHGLKYVQSVGLCPIKVGTYEDLIWEDAAILTAKNGAGKQIGLRVVGE